MKCGTRSWALAAIVLLLPLAGCDWINAKLNRAPQLRFAEAGDPYLSKPDFARVEHDYPLAPADLQKLTPKNLANYSQEQVDQIYARLTAGPIPDGAFDGRLFFPKNAKGDRRIAEIVGGLPGLAVELKSQQLETLGRHLWRGKVFYRDERLLRNRIEDIGALQPIIDGDLSQIPKTKFGNGEQWLMFPARLYCGQSLLDSRRESIIIDYAFTDELPGYRERPDYLAGRNGFQIRDEIRMVRPGFYLGRAYVGKAFLLNFVLYNDAIAKAEGDGFVKTGQITEDCWPGTQDRTLLAATSH
ncbi:hypothetical protein [Povalibacter sp.]|uniref:hypothetical protein n=1 Tax=Povalibacter sp. TaxID=1962978 RepID=UPI002F41ABF8